MRESIKILVAAIGAILAGGGAFFLHQQRDVIFVYDWRPTRNFSELEDAGLRQAAVASVQAKRPGTHCVSQWVGRDETYAYLSVGCALFKRSDRGVYVEGDQNFRPARFRLKGASIENFEILPPGSGENALRRIYPRPAGDRVRVRLNEEEYRRLGLAAAEAPAGAL